MNHTPGPWKVMGEDVVLMRDEREVVAWVGDIDGQMTDNANLIAAAPDLLRELERLENQSGLPLERDDPARVAARTAIRKARGEV